MDKTKELLERIKEQISQNNAGLTSEDTRFQDLNQRCENITNHLTSIEQVLDQLNKFSNGIEVAPEDVQQTLRELNLHEVTGDGLRLKFEEIFQLALDGNQELTDKIKDTEKELEQILANLQTQQQIITRYQSRITQLETKIISNENQARDLQLKASLIGASIMGGFGGLAILIAKFRSKFKKRT